MKIKSIEKVDAFDIWDISVPNGNCFILENGVVAHNSMYPKSVISGGTGVMYSSNTAFIITKAQEKVGTDIVGYNFTINIEKSRFVKEKSKLTFQVLWDSGINKYSGLLEIALESGHVIKPSNGWYSRVNVDTGEVEDKKYRLKDTYTKEFWDEILNSKSFQDFVKRKFQLGMTVKNEEDYDESDIGDEE